MVFLISAPERAEVRLAPIKPAERKAWTLGGRCGWVHGVPALSVRLLTSVYIAVIA